MSAYEPGSKHYSGAFHNVPTNVHLIQNYSVVLLCIFGGVGVETFRPSILPRTASIRKEVIDLFLQAWDPEV